MFRAKQGEWYLITGGSSGIGLATAERLQALGHRVVSVSRAAKRCGRAADASLELDLCSFESAQSMRSELGSMGIDRLAGCFLSAGGGGFIPVSSAVPREAVDLATLNLVSPYLTVGALRPLLVAGSSVVLCGSAVARGRAATAGIYAAAKAGLESITRTLASELGPHIRVNCVCPGAIETPIYGKLGIDIEAIRARAASKIPLGRLGNASEVANVVCFLLSELASYVSGAIVDVHGGGLPDS